MDAGTRVGTGYRRTWLIFPGPAGLFPRGGPPKAGTRIPQAAAASAWPAPAPGTFARAHLPAAVFAQHPRRSEDPGISLTEGDRGRTWNECHRQFLSSGKLGKTLDSFFLTGISSLYYIISTVAETTEDTLQEGAETLEPGSRGSVSVASLMGGGPEPAP